MDEIKDKLLDKKLTLAFAVLIGLLFSFVTVANSLAKNDLRITLSLTIAVVFMLLVIITARKNQIIAAKYILVISPPFLILITSVINFSTDGVFTTYAYLIPFLCNFVYLISPIIFFGLALKKKMIFSFILILPTVILFHYTHELFGIKQSEIIHSSDYYYLLLFLFFIFYILILSSILLIQKTNIKYKDKINSQNKILEIDKKDVASSNEQLKSIIQENSDFETFINNNTDIIFMLNKYGKLLYFSKQIKKITGFTEEELVGKRFTNFVPKKEIPKCFTKLKEMFQNDSISPFETFVNCKDSMPIPVEVSGNIHKHNNEWVGLGTIRDITIRKEERNTIEYQSNLYSILDITSKNKPIKEIFEDTLHILYKIPSLNVEKKGVIFLTNENGDLELIAEINAKILRETCALIQPGKCLCGKALQLSKTLFCNSVGHDHTIHPTGMTPHGHYIIPIKTEEKVLGMICLYIKHGEEKSELTIKYLEMVANVLSRKIISQQRHKILTKKNIEINDQHTLLNTVMNKLQDSINYTQHLQSSLLPNQKTLNKYLQDCAVLFLPKDKVSGDFYFSHAIDNYLYFGVGDCTGHGIPGAFLSSMSIESVKSVIYSNIGEKPNFLLEKLRDISKTRFNTNTNNERTDSLDMALCLFDKNENTFYYSGGFIGIILIKKDKEIIAIDSTKCPIGEYPFKHNFQLNKINVEEGDTLYIASDGYIDQFGMVDKSTSKKSKKFMNRKFKQLLLDIHMLNCSEQVTILKNTIKEWRGNIEQTDDITVFIAKYK